MRIFAVLLLSACGGAAPSPSSTVTTAAAPVASAVPQEPSSSEPASSEPASPEPEPTPPPPTGTLTLARGDAGEIAGLSVRYIDTGFAETNEGCFQFHQLVVSEGAQREEHTVRSGEVLAVMGRNLTVTGNAEQIVLESR